VSVTAIPLENARKASSLRICAELLSKTFETLRRCGGGYHECQTLWVGPWADETLISDVIHPLHRAYGDGFELDGAWLTKFWLELARKGWGVRLQAHTHPRAAFHSETDDHWPLIHTEGFLSLVIPNFAFGPLSFDRAYLTQMQRDGTWKHLEKITDWIAVE